MKKFFTKVRKANKGFTLVELIIVIAVMAVLTVVVAPQYLKYVESSREATDVNALGELKHIVEISYIEGAVAGEADNTIAIVIDANGGFTYQNASDKLETRVNKIYPSGAAYTFKSTAWKGKTVTFTVDATTGICTTNPKF